MRCIPLKSLFLSLSILLFLSTSAFAQNKFVYTNNDPFAAANSVTAFQVGAGGALTQIAGSPFATGGLGGGGGLFASNRAEICSMGNTLYVVNLFTCDITGFAINPTTGFLTQVPGSPFPMIGGGIPDNVSLACTPDGKFLYMSDDDADTLAVYARAANGVLTPIPGVFPTGGDPASLKVTPDGKFIYSAIRFAGISGWAINANGSLTLVPGSPFPAGVTRGIDVNCAANRIFGGEAVIGSVSVQSQTIAANGTLTPVPGSPFVFAGASNSNVVLVSPDDRFLFVSNQGPPPTVTVFTIAAGGALTVVPGSPFPVPMGDSPAGMATDQQGTLLYVANLNNRVAVFQIAANGALTSVPGSSFPTNVNNGSLLNVAAFPGKTCLDICVQDDATGRFIRFSSSSGNYVYTDCSKGITLTGRGTITTGLPGDFCKLELRDSGPDPKRPDRSIFVSVNPCTFKGDASIRFGQQNVILGDQNINNNTCSCQ